MKRFQEKMMPGQEPYTKNELEQVRSMINDACEAEEKIDLDELEEHALSYWDRYYELVDRRYQAWKDDGIK